MKQTRNFVYVDDNVRLCLEAFFTEEANGRPMNIGSGKSVKIIDLAKTIKKIIKEAKIAHKPLRIDGEIIYRVPDVTFMKKALNDWPKIELEEGLKKTIIYLKKKNK